MTYANCLRPMSVVLPALLLVATPALATWNGRILDARTGGELTESGLAEKLRGARHVVLGEKHNTPAVQSAQARMIRATVAAAGATGNFTTGWEFLNYADAPITADAFARFAAGTLDGAGFLTATQGNAYNSSYIPILEATRDLGGHLIGLNLSRAQKAPVVQHGITAADPAVVPSGFAMGGEGYLARFTEAMTGGHATPEQVGNYFAAQCLTDDVMAAQLLQAAAPALRFVIAGSFHTDFFDGTVGRIKARAPGDAVAVVRLIDASDYAEAELLPLLNDARYGAVADFVYFVNEPAPAL